MKSSAVWVWETKTFEAMTTVCLHTKIIPGGVTGFENYASTRGRSSFGLETKNLKNKTPHKN